MRDESHTETRSLSDASSFVSVSLCAAGHCLRMDRQAAEAPTFWAGEIYARSVCIAQQTFRLIGQCFACVNCLLFF